MTILHFDDAAFSWNIPTKDVVNYAGAGDDSLDDWFFGLAKDWTCNKNITCASAGLYLIHAHGCFTKLANRQDLEGVEILKHIRLTNWLGQMRQWHALIYSFEPLEDILRKKPGDLILASHDVTFIRLPDALDLEVAVQAVHEGKKDRLALRDLAECPDYRSVEDRKFHRFVACDYTPPASEHAISNWWGAHQLVLRVRQIGGDKNIRSFPAGVESELRKLDNKKAFFLAGRPRSNEGWIDAIDKQTIRREMKRVRKFFQEGTSPAKIVYVDDEMDKGWDEALYLTLTGESLPTDGVSWFHTTMGQLAQTENSSEDWLALADMILQECPDLILTDLRLLGSREATTPVKDTSGARLIESLRMRAPGVPILLLTASNKAWTFQEAFRLGVDAYWMKEGIGDHAAPTRSIENTAELMRLLGHLLGPDYQLLRKIHQRTNEFEREWNDGNPPWWKRMQWPAPIPDLGSSSPPPPPISEPNGPAVFSLLRNVVRTYREYLRLFTLRYGSQDLRENQLDETTDFWLRPLVVHVGRIIECIHCFDEIRLQVDPGLKAGQRSLASAGTIGGYPNFRDRCAHKMRRDWFGQAIYDIRNIAAHYDPEVPVMAPKNIRSLLAALFAWLSVTPACKENPSHLRVGSSRSRTLWPKAKDFFEGPDMQDDLVQAYSELFGSSVLDLPTRRL